MKENNSPLENLKDEYKMLLLRDRIQQNKWIKRLCNKTFIKHKIKVMTQEEKQLLLKDLCARLPYQPLCKKVDTEDDFCECDAPLGYSLRDLVDNKIIIKPYLRPMSSMTEEEKHELLRFGTVNLDKNNNVIDVCCVGFLNHAKVQDYLNSIHIDYHGLIEKGLAIKVTLENNPYKNNEV